MVIRRAVRSATTKDIDEKRIMIGRDCGFFVVFDSVSSLGNDWNRGGWCIGLAIKRGRGDSTRNSIP